MNKMYAIFNVSEIDKIDFNQVLETSVDTLRKSVDGNKTFVKWMGDVPSSVEALTFKEYLTPEEMVLLMPTAEWHSPILLTEAPAK